LAAISPETPLALFEFLVPLKKVPPGLDGLWHFLSSRDRVKGGSLTFFGKPASGQDP